MLGDGTLAMPTFVLCSRSVLGRINQVTHTSDELAGLPLGGRAIEIPMAIEQLFFRDVWQSLAQHTMQ